MTLYMKVTQDKYEHPVVIADSVEELAKLCGVKTQTIRSCISRYQKHGRFSRYVRIECEEE